MGCKKVNYDTRKSNRVQVSKFRLVDAADLRDGARLIKAFLEIKELAWREKLICWAEELAKASSGCRETALVEENRKRAFFGSSRPGRRTRCTEAPRVGGPPSSSSET
jgi:hypothetical protein